MLLGVLDHDLVLANTVTDCHGIVGESGEGGDERGQDVEQAFLLPGSATCTQFGLLLFTYDWDTEGHDVEGEGRQKHDHEDHPVKHQYIPIQ